MSPECKRASWEFVVENSHIRSSRRLSIDQGGVFLVEIVEASFVISVLGNMPKQNAGVI